MEISGSDRLSTQRTVQALKRRNHPVDAPTKVAAALERQFGERIVSIKVIEQSTFAHLHGRHVLATTRPNRIYLAISGAEFFDDPVLVLHEYFHVLRQWNTGELTVLKYLWASIKNGNAYWANPYEVEARQYVRANIAAFRALLGQPN